MYFFILIFILITIFFMSYIEIDIKKYEFDYSNNINDFKIYLKIKFLGVTYLKFLIDNNKTEKYKTSKLKKIFNVKNIKHIDNLKLELKKINLKLDICLIDPFLTAISIGTAYSIIFTRIAKFIKKGNKEKIKILINPIYNLNKIQIKLEAKCIITIKFVHIISTICKILQKPRRKEKNERTSNRRAYAFSNE